MLSIIALIPNIISVMPVLELTLFSKKICKINEKFKELFQGIFSGRVFLVSQRYNFASKGYLTIFTGRWHKKSGHAL